MTTTARARTAPTASPALKKPPRLEGGFPLIGHTIDFARDPVGLLQRAYEECGRVAQFKLFGKSVTLFTGPRRTNHSFDSPTKC